MNRAKYLGLGVLLAYILSTTFHLLDIKDELKAIHRYEMGIHALLLNNTQAR